MVAETSILGYDQTRTCEKLVQPERGASGRQPLDRTRSQDMLGERIATVAPNMPSDIRRWFLERDYSRPSVEHQDWDLVLAHPEYVPLIVEYARDVLNPLEKRFEALSALFVLLEQPGANTSESYRIMLKQEVRRIVVDDQDFAGAFSEWIGGVPSFVVKKMLGEELPADLPAWMHDEIQRRT